jgi:uncharacterized C2H2 Zn-finger protein
MLTNGSSQNLWPVHLKPKDDELISSWLTRLALAHGLNAVKFSSIEWPKKSLFLANVDRASAPEILETLARRTGTAVEKVRGMQLTAYEGLLYTNNNNAVWNGMKLFAGRPWIMPVNCARKSKQFGLQFCPYCLQEDKEPYFRRRWRLAFVTLCEQHGELLHDRCPRCGERVNFEARTLAIKIKLRRGTLAYCLRCDYDFRNTKRTQPRLAVTPDEIDFQKFLLDALNEGRVQISGSGFVYSHLYFTVLHKLLRMLTLENCNTLCQRSISDYFGVSNFEVSLPRYQRYIESLDVPERRALLGMVRLLLKDWPDGFITFCRANNSIWYGESLEYLDGSIGWSGPLFDYMEDIPFWYWKVVCDHLPIRMYRQRKPRLKYISAITSSIDYYREQREPAERKLEEMLSDISMTDRTSTGSDMVDNQPSDSEADYYFLRVHEYWPGGFRGQFEIVREIEATVEV